MTDNEFFDSLTERNSKASDMFKLPEWEGLFNGVIDKYKDSAHFVYELLQNADDAKATEVEMILEKDKFIFIHNGSEKFTISNPTTIVEDRITINPHPLNHIIKKSDPGGT